MFWGLLKYHTRLPRTGTSQIFSYISFFTSSFANWRHPNANPAPTLLSVAYLKSTPKRVSNRVARRTRMLAKRFHFIYAYVLCAFFDFLFVILNNLNKKHAADKLCGPGIFVTVCGPTTNLRPTGTIKIRI